MSNTPVSRHLRRILTSTAAGALLLAAHPAWAAGDREAELEARIAQLEAIVAAMRDEMASNRAQQQAAAAEAASTAKAAQAMASAAEQKVAAIEARPQAPAEGFRVGNTSVKLGGYLKTVASFSRWDDGDVAANSLGRDFYLPQAIPVGGTRESTDSDFSAKQARLWLNLETNIAGQIVKGYLETDFQTSPGTQGSERTTNGYNLALRRAYLQYGNLTVGQDWSTFQNAAVLPESTDYVGATEGTVFVRQPLVRYSKKLGKAATLHVSVENAETATAQPGATFALVEQDDDRLPDLAARLNISSKIGEFALAGVLRQLSADTGGIGDRATGWGVSGSGKIGFGPEKRHDLRVMATYGRGIGRYVGLNFAPDAILLPATGQLETPSVFAGLAALRIGLSQRLRANLIASYQNVDYPDGFTAANIGAFNATSFSYAGNLFWSPVKNIDLGVEYRHGVRELVDGQKGQLDRLEFAAKYNF